MRWNVALKLGRISNLPTVWTNVLAGTVLAGGTVTDPRFALLLLAMSLFYVSGMYLNDAFDAQIDAAERPERPIPSGQVTLRTVTTSGVAMLVAGVVVLIWVGFAGPTGTGLWPALAGLLLGAAIVFYNWHHKHNPLSPLVMGLCRMLVYIAAGVSVAVPLPPAVIVGSLLLLSYLIGLTYIAKQENLSAVGNIWPLAFLAAPIIYGVYAALDAPNALIILAGFAIWIMLAVRFVARHGRGDIPKAVINLIAGISLLDAMLIAIAGAPKLALLSVAGFALTLALQRFIPGT